MVSFINCSIQNKEIADFNINYRTSFLSQQKTYSVERDTCFGEENKDPLSWLSFGFFILALGIVFSLNTDVFSDFGFWIEQMADKGIPVRPPTSLISSAILFFGMIGISDFGIATIRVFIDKEKRRIISDILTGVALVLFAYLIHMYNAYFFMWQTVLGIEIVVIGLLVILYTLVRAS